MQSNNGSNLIIKLTFDFAIKIIRFRRKLEENRRFVIATQIIRSGTSIGANVREAQNAESLSDFIHKMKIAAKEADETEYWLMLCKESYVCDCEDLIFEIKPIIKVLSKIISTSKTNR